MAKSNENKPSLKEYRELAREYAEKRGQTIPYRMLGSKFTLNDIVKAFKRNPQWVEFRNNKWKIRDRYFPEFRMTKDV